MWYSFYMNERMLLDEWEYYQRKGECNWLLKRTLMNDNTRTAEEKIQFYKENRRVINNYPEWFKERAEQVKEYTDSLEGCFENDEQMEHYIEKKYFNDGYDMMDYGRAQRAFNTFRRYNDLKERANEKVETHLSFNPIKGAKFREHEVILINKKDIKNIREARKYNDFTVSQIEVLFGIIFFCRMNKSEKANLNSKFKKKQFLGCFDNATMEDLEYVVDHVYYIDKTDDGDYIYRGFHNWVYRDRYDEWCGDDWIAMNVTRFNNKLNLTKVTHKFIRDISTKRYCAMCLKPFEPTNNRQKVCSECKPKADAIKTRMRKVKQRYIEKNGKDACCGKCTDCIQMDCMNWFEYWYQELDIRELEYKDKNNYPYPRYNYDIPEEEHKKIVEQLLYDIKNVYTEDEKDEIMPWEYRWKFKRYC